MLKLGLRHEVVRAADGGPLQRVGLAEERRALAEHHAYDAGPVGRLQVLHALASRAADFVQGQPRQALVEALHDGIQRVHLHDAVDLGRDGPRDATAQRQHEQHAPLGERHDLEALQHAAGHAGREDDAEQARQAAQQAARLLRDGVQAAQAPADRLAEQFGLLRRKPGDIHQAIHVEPVAALGGDAPGGRVRVPEVARVLQPRHDGPDGGAGEVHLVGDGARPDRRSRVDKLLHDPAQHVALAGGEAFGQVGRAGHGG